jgi:hypothetical protein
MPSRMPEPVAVEDLDADALARELVRTRQEMLEYLRALPPRPNEAYRRDAAKWHARMKLAHRLLLELRGLATVEQRDRIDAELNRP